MKNVFLLRLFKIIGKTITQILSFIYRIALTVLLDKNLDKRIKTNAKREKEYDEHAESITQRKFLP